MALFIIGITVLGMAYFDKLPGGLKFPYINENKKVLTIHATWSQKTTLPVHIICDPCGIGNPTIYEYKTESPFIATYEYDGYSPISVVVTANQSIVVNCAILIDGDVKDYKGDLMIAKCDWPRKGR